MVAGGRNHCRSLLRRLSVIWLALAGAAANVQAADPVTPAQSREAWQHIASVLQHPRCLNCHQADVPLQGDARRLHVPLVERGPQGLGVGAMVCANCHNASGNNETSRTPGAPHWSLAPKSMLWQGLSVAQLCQQLKDPNRNGNRTPAQIVEHMETEQLVLWGWKPGAGRQPVPMPHDEFIRYMKTWVAGGTACPA